MPASVAAPPIVAVVPFVLMLLAIALLPVIAPRRWDSNRNKLVVAVALGLPILAAYLARDPRQLVLMAEEYVSFIIMLTGLYVIAGGIRLSGDLQATPLTNAGFLALGAVLASFIGTTGASMLLIRPLIQTNRERARVRHTIVFFIFLVSNVGGMLTPLGDPPLFLGYLQGVPFTWTFRLWGPWLAMVLSLLVVYVVWDAREYTRESLAVLRRDRSQVEPLRIRGGLNALWLGGIVAAVAVLHAPWREAAIIAFAALAFWSTTPHTRRANRVSAGPMIEVAVLFFGVFLTMIPALEILRVRGGELPVREPWHFFWATGALSAFLDNAPTYLTFLALGQGLHLAPDVAGVPHEILAAISVGAVAMGATTYIGNAPNFMVKAIAEHAGIEMPTFTGYMAYSGTVLIPLFVAVTVLFF